MNNLCPPCVSKLAIEEQITRIKNLNYKIRSSNMKNVINDEYYKKVNRPNFYYEMGNDKAETATDRFSESEYLKEMNSILEMELDLPPEIID